MRRINLSIAGGIIAILAFFIAFVIVIWQLGFFEFTTGDEAGAGVVAAAIALVGVLFTGVASIIGIIIKQSIDERAEKRLNQEAAIKAIQSLSSGGKEVPMTQRAGILFALTNLGLIELAVTLLCQMVNKGEIDATAADIIIDRGLRSNNKIAQDEAICLLSQVASKLLILNGKARFPSCLLDYNLKLPGNIRREGLAILVEQMLSKPYSDWDYDFMNDRRSTLITVWKTEKYMNMRNFAGYCLHHMCKLWNDEIERKLYWSYGNNKWVDCSELATELNKLCLGGHVDEHYRQLIERVEIWVNNSLSASTSGNKQSK